MEETTLKEKIRALLIDAGTNPKNLSEPRIKLKELKTQDEKLFEKVFLNTIKEEKQIRTGLQNLFEYLYPEFKE